MQLVNCGFARCNQTDIDYMVSLNNVILLANTQSETTLGVKIILFYHDDAVKCFCLVWQYTFFIDEI